MRPSVCTKAVLTLYVLLLRGCAAAVRAAINEAEEAEVAHEMITLATRYEVSALRKIVTFHDIRDRHATDGTRRSNPK